ncbi:hypothetical protein C1H84_10185 [Glutamicibacter soli]|uniref:Uncharacterized protein n=1 Tax=Glutamicibacter soli TaxID=453836 RepID=A0A365YEM6_9MICC|nr:hypothetical protein C1H84_10185 [Glutamicibacter soli]
MPIFPERSRFEIGNPGGVGEAAARGGLQSRVLLRGCWQLASPCGGIQQVGRIAFEVPCCAAEAPGLRDVRKLGR